MATDGRPTNVVSPADSESLLAGIASSVTDGRVGIFGPNSASWLVNREAAVFLGAGRAALLQLAHPWVAAALAQHSNVIARPIARFHNTFRVVYTMIFGSLDQAIGAGKNLYRLHSTIQGELTESTAGWPRGVHYQANEIAPLRWVFATLVESAEMAWSCALGPMPTTLREQYYADSVKLAALFGLPASELPEDWVAFAAYNNAMHKSDELGVSVGARKMAHDLLSGTGSWLHIPRWYRALTTEWMPLRFREEFELNMTESDRNALANARKRIPRSYGKLPTSLRFVGPWHEAQARLAGRTAGPITRLSNRFWIGQVRLPFDDRSGFEFHKGAGHEALNRRTIGIMDPRETIDPEQLDELNRAFSDQLLACLDACARGRHGLFADPVSGDDEEHSWPEAARLRELAVALQSILAQQNERNALCDEFLDLCTIHGESHPGERRLARNFLERIERSEVGSPTEDARKPW